MADSDSTPTPVFGKFARLIDIAFRSDSPHEARFKSGTFCIFEEPAADNGAVVILLTPAAAGSKPLRLMLDFDAALEAAHSLISAAARLRRAAAG